MKRALLIVLLVELCGVSVCADTIIFKNGKRLDSDNVWRDGNQVKCMIFGSEVGYPASEIRKIEKSQPKPEKRVVEAPPAQKPARTYATTRRPVTKNQILNGLTKVYNLEQSNLADGRTRYLGRAKNKMSVLETIGPVDNLTQASHSISLPDGRADIIAFNFVAGRCFIKNAVPEWNGVQDWYTQASMKIMKGEKEIIKKVRHKTITIRDYPQLKMIMTIVSFK